MPVWHALRQVTSSLHVTQDSRFPFKESNGTSQKENLATSFVVLGSSIVLSPLGVWHILNCFRFSPLHALCTVIHIFQNDWHVSHVISGKDY